MVKLRKLHLLSFVVLLSSFFALFNQAQEYYSFSEHYQTFDTKTDAFSREKHHGNSLTFLAELLDLEEESNTEEDNSENLPFDQPIAFYLRIASYNFSNNLLRRTSNKALEHHFVHQPATTHIPVYKQVCVFRI